MDVSRSQLAAACRRALLVSRSLPLHPMTTLAGAAPQACSTSKRKLSLQCLPASCKLPLGLPATSRPLP